MKTADQLDYRPAGIAIDAANHKLYVGDTGRSMIYAYDIGAAGDLSAQTTVVTQIAQPTALLVDACGGLYMGGADTGNVHRRAPGPGITAGAALRTVAQVDGPDVVTLAFGSGKHGWSDQSLFLLDTWDGILSEVPLKK
jgi:sugar lactone lactonase YvrE